MGEEEEVVESTTLEETPTWAVAIICAILITISLLLEYGLHLLTKFLQRNRRRSLNQALYKMKSELMLLGFISLLLTASQSSISKICIPMSVGETYLPCQNTIIPSDVVEESICQEKGKVSLLSRQGVQDLQFLMFVLGFFHALSCVLAFALGMAKMRRWESWEAETTTLEYQFTNDPRRFMLTHQTTFGRRHMKYWSQHPLLRWPVCFLRQFKGSLSKDDYFTLRHGFIMAHFSGGKSFDFQKFLKRALDDDFHVVVGTSLWLWVFIILSIFFNAYGFYSYYWVPFIPLVVLLLIGTKLQVIITRMCFTNGETAPFVRGTFLVKPSDDFFWFGRPRLLLHLMHFILFQNSFLLAFFTWTWCKYGFKSCFHRTTKDIVIRIAIGIMVQLLCGYVTLPLYALVTQMGSSMKKAVFNDRIIKGLKNWHDSAKRSIATSKTNSTTSSVHITPSHTEDTSVSKGKEFESVEFDLPSDDFRNKSVTEIKEEEKFEKEMDDRGSYNGEITLRWRNEIVAELPEDNPSSAAIDSEKSSLHQP
ncbi:MLO-like protein 12 [Telopea speciosissima]|uniref:MLO-like protein 12 n=1 Tax=Telopea speciosissima TaxID=54955 RepID=UPI001CC4CBEB|nr:MLO-like protein 12 [Telopea speciosissima]